MSDSNKALKEKLLSSRKNGFDRVDAAELEQMEAYCKEYMTFLHAGKTERLCAAETVRLAEQAGYKPLVRGQALMPVTRCMSAIAGRACCWPISAVSP